MTASQFVNYYEVLQVARTATADDIRKAVTQQRRLWVKRQTSSDPSRRTEAEARVRDIDRAEKVLLDRSTRSAFDRELSDYRPPEEAQARDGEGDWLDRARAYLAMDNPRAANYAAREAINLRGNDDAAWFVRAHSSFLLGNSSDAEYEFAEAIRLRPDNGLYHYGLGETYSAQQKWRSALSQYEEALRLEPGNPEYRTSIAQVYLQNDKSGDALRIMEEVVRAHGDNPAFKYYLAIALHDDALDSLGQIRPLVANGTVIDPGGYFILSEEQADLMAKRATRIRGLNVDDPDIAQMVADIEKLVAESREVKCDYTNVGKWAVAVVIFGLIPFFGGISSGSAGSVLMGVLVILGLGCTFAALKIRPSWKHRLYQAKASNRLQRTGI